MAWRRFILTLLFLLAQAGAQTHALSHAHAGHDADDPDLSPAHACELCLAFAPLGAGAAPGLKAWSPPPAAFPPAAPLAAKRPARVRAPLYRSRAPPA